MRGDVKSIKKTYSTLDKYYDKNLKEHFKGILNIENYINNFSNKERELNLKIENEKLTNRIYLGLLIGLCSLLLLFGVISIFLNKRKKQMDKLRLERDLFEKNLSQLSEINEQRKFQDSMILLDDKEGYKIKLSEIAYIKASQGTVEFYDVENQLIIRIHKTLSRFLGEINMDKVFIRISKFHALNKNHISGVSKSSVRVGSKVDLAWSAKYLSSSDLEF